MRSLADPVAGRDHLLWVIRDRWYHLDDQTSRSGSGRPP